MPRCCCSSIVCVLHVGARTVSLLVPSSGGLLQRKQGWGAGHRPAGVTHYIPHFS